MPSRSLFPVPRHALGSVLLVLASCGLFTDSDDRRPARLEAVGSEVLPGSVGEPVADSLVVRVRNGRNRPVRGVPVTFTATHGSVSPGEVLTDDEGIARAGWTLGTSAAEQTATAAVGGLTVTFRANAQAGPPARVRITPDSTRVGRGQTVELRADLSDAFGNPATGVVTWSTTDPEVVTVSEQGVVRGVNGGSAWVVASVGALADSASARVLTPLTITVSSPSPDTVFSTPAETGAFGAYGRVTSASPITRVSYSLNDGAEKAFPLTGTDPQSAHWSIFEMLPAGEHRIRIRAEDADGNRETLERRVVMDSGTRVYTLRFLGTLGGDDSEGLDLNDRGEVVGSARDATGAERAVLWREGTILDLGLTPGSRATAISEEGIVVGTYQDDCRRSFLWRGGERSTIGECGLSAVDVNDHGTVVFAERKVLRDGVLVSLESSTGQLMSTAARVGSNDVVLGVTRGVCGGGFCSFGPMLIAPPYGPGDVTVYLGGGWVVDMNDAGDIVAGCGGGSGQYTCAGRVHHADGRRVEIVWKQRVSGDHGTVSAIGAGGQVIGMTDQASGRRPYLWRAGRFSRVEVQGGGWTLDRLVEINARGQILAHGRNPATGQMGAVLLTPVP